MKRTAQKTMESFFKASNPTVKHAKVNGRRESNRV